MRTKDQCIADFHEWIPFVRSLRSLHPDQWSIPMSQGKWSVRDTVSHIVRWDEYYLEEALKPIEHGKPLTLRFVDIDDFNEEAIQWGQGLDQNQLIQEAVTIRNLLLKTLQHIPDTSYHQEFVVMDQVFVIERYLDDFIRHDQHHMKQISTWLASTSS